MAERTPVVKPLEVSTRLAEEFKFHLLELTHAENEVTGRDFVTERFTDLTDTKGEFLSRRTLYVYEVGENTLRRFGTEINGIFSVFGNALESLKHKVELTDISKVMFFTSRAGNIVFFNERFHFFV